MADEATGTRSDGSGDGAADGPVLEVDDDAWLGQADWVIGGEASAKARAQGRYAAYLLLLFSLVYGFPFVQAVFRTSDRVWLRDQLTSPAALAIVVAAVGALMGAAFWAGRTRGPVVPPLPWIDLVLSAPVDRALALRRWWRFAVAGGLLVGGLLGLVLGGGLAYSEVTGVVAIPVVTVAGLLAGLVTTRLWLWGQARTWPGPDRGPGLLWRIDDALRELHVESMRAHSANTSTLAGSAMTGNLRTARLALAPPVRHARSARLRPGRPIPVIVRRDVLGMRRQPALLAAGLGLVALGTAVLLWGVTQTAAPGFAVTLALLPLYLGYGALAEGLRLQADNIGTPSLIGVAALPEAAAHLVVPTLLTGGALGGGLALASLWSPVTGDSVVAVTVVLALLCGGHLLAAFRGAPDVRYGPQAMIAWYLRPSVIVVVLGSLVPFLTKTGVRAGWIAAVCWVVAAVLVWGFARVQRLTHLHRA
jgi:hypothetical protein